MLVQGDCNVGEYFPPSASFLLISRFPVGIKVFLYWLPHLVIIMIHFLTGFVAPFGDSHAQTAFKHERLTRDRNILMIWRVEGFLSRYTCSPTQRRQVAVFVRKQIYTATSATPRSTK